MSRIRTRFFCCATLALLVLSGCRALDLNPVSLVGFSNEIDEESTIESTFSRSHLLMSSARKFERAGQIEEAIKLYEKVLDGGSKQADTYEANRHLAVLYDLSDQSSKAKNAFKLALQSGNPDVDLLNDYGYFLSKNNEHSEATELLKRAHSSFPDNERVTTNLAMALVSSGRVNEGFQLFTSVVDKPEAASNVGAVLLQLGKNQEAQKWLQRAIDSNQTGRKLVATNMLQLANPK